MDKEPTVVAPGLEKIVHGEGAGAGRPRAWVKFLATALLLVPTIPFSSYARDWHSDLDKYLTTKNAAGRENGDLYYDYTDAGSLAWAESYYLDAFLQLYRTYRDRKYLDRFQKHGDKIIENMSDNDKDHYSGWNAPKYGTEKISNGGFETYEQLSASSLPNGGFETADVGDPTLPSGWTRWSNSTYAYRSPGGIDGYDGAFAVIKTTSNWSLLQYSWTTYKSSASYQLSFVGRTNSHVKGRVDVRDETVNPPVVLKTYYFTETDWTRHTFLFVTPLETGHNLKLRFYYDNKLALDGEADFDDVRLSENLILNGGFEGGDTFPSQWFIPSGYGDVTHFRRTLDAGEFYSGTAGLELRSGANTYEILEQYFPYEPGAIYTVSFFAKTNGKVKGRLDVYDHDWVSPATQGQFNQVYFNHTDWRRYSISFTAPALSGHHIGIRCFDEHPFEEKGLIYFDDITVVKAAGPNLPGKGTLMSSWRSSGLGAYPSVSAGGPSTSLVLEGTSRVEQTLFAGYLPNWEYQVSVVGNGNVHIDVLDGVTSLAGRDLSLASWTTPQTFRFKMPATADHPILLRLTGNGSTVSLDDISVKIAGENIVHYGKIAAPLGQFVTLVKNDPSLTSTYGASAEKYRVAIEDQIIPRWESSWQDLSATQGVYINPTDECQEFVRAGVTLPHNQYLAFARLLLESYRFSGKTAYLEKAQKMGNAFKSKLRINPSHPTAYVWDYSNDMKPNDDGFAETHYVEDSSHANIDIGLAIEFNHQGIVFDNTDMARFASTFIDAMNLSSTATYDTVDGVRSDLHYHAYGEWVNLAEFRPQIWTQLQGILGPQPTVYYGTFPAPAGLCRWDPDHLTVTGAVLSDIGGLAKSSTSITWTWADRVDNEYGFQVRRATDDYELVTLSSGAVVWSQQGLSPNTGYKVKVSVFAASPGASTVGVSSTVFTWANAPVSLATTSVTASAIGLSFGTNGNPNGTRYEVEKAVGAGSYSLALTTTSSSMTMGGLSDATSHRFRVRALNNDGFASAYSGIVTVATLDGTRPNIALTAPAPNATFTSPLIVLITANASDNVAVTKVRFILDGVTVSTDTTSPYAYNWPITAGSNGAHMWSATAFDAAGNSSTTLAVPVTVNIDATKPSVVLSAPLSGMTYTAPESVAIAASAFDDGGITKVWFALDGVTVSTDTTDPYETIWPITIANNGPHTWSATAFDAMGNSSTSVPVSVTVEIDGTPPSAPGALSATDISASTIQLTWTPSSDEVGVAGYHVQRGTSTIATVAGDVTSYSDTGLSPATDYSYSVSAFDAAGNESTPSASITVTTQRLPLAQPVGTVAAVRTQSVDLRWDLVSGATRYTVAAALRRDPGDFSLQSESNGSNGALSGLTPNTTYYFFGNACDEARCSDFAFFDSAVTQANVPGLAMGHVMGKEVQLTIDPKGNPVGTVYHVEARKEGGNYALKTAGTNLSPVVGELTPGGKYTFRVFAQNHAGIPTAPSNEENSTLAPATLDGARAYPVPFRPGQGATGITFDRLPEGTNVRIFTVDGQPVTTLTTNSEGLVQWDLTNDEGSPVASGVYMAMNEKNGAKKKLKIVVQK